MGLVWLEDHSKKHQPKFGTVVQAALCLCAMMMWQWLGYLASCLVAKHCVGWQIEQALFPGAATLAALLLI